MQPRRDNRSKHGQEETSARQQGKDKGTISRKLRPKQAQAKAEERRRSVRKATIHSFGWAYVTHLLVERKWSPEQIRGRLT